MRKKKPIDALFPQIRQQILAATLLHPEKWWYLSDLAHHLGRRPSSLQRELASLVGAGVLRRTQEGNRAYFQPDPECPFLSELQGILIKTAGLADVLRDALGPFTDRIRPFTVNGEQTLCFVTINNLLGFEIGDLRTGKMIHRIEVAGFERGRVKRHGCPSHGVGLTPDEKEIWVTDGANRRLHVFDATVMPPAQTTSIALRDEPGWITFSIDGTLAYPSTGDVVDVRTHKVIAGLTDEEGRAVQSEKLLEIDFRGQRAVRAGDQFGVGRVRRR